MVQIKCKRQFIDSPTASATPTTTTIRATPTTTKTSVTPRTATSVTPTTTSYKIKQGDILDCLFCSIKYNRPIVLKFIMSKMLFLFVMCAKAYLINNECENLIKTWI